MTAAERDAIEAACSRLIRRYALLNDAGEWDAVAACFTEDGLLARPSAPDAPLRGRDAILAAFRARPPRKTRHVCTNIVIDVIASDEARAESVMLLFSGVQAADGGLPVLDPGSPVPGTFADRIALTPDGWRFAERRGALDFRPR